MWKIYGVGVDIVEISRFENHEKIAKKILTEPEFLKYQASKFKQNFVAKSFSAKESVSKAFGVGIGSNLGFKDIEILRNNVGAPYVNIDQSIGMKILKSNIFNVYISISDNKNSVITYCTLEIFN